MTMTEHLNTLNALSLQLMAMEHNIDEIDRA